MGFEKAKGWLVSRLHRRRGKLIRPFVHSGMASITALGLLIAPIVAEEFPGVGEDPWATFSPSEVLSAATVDTTTEISSDTRGKIIEYTVAEGDTVSSIADKFGVSTDTVLWQNNLSAKSLVKPGMTLEILPVSGVSHKVQKGDTVYSIAKKYNSEAQAVVDFPFNTFVNDETFALAVGQIVIVPDGVPPAEVPARPPSSFAKQKTPDAGTVVASGAFVWPASGTITQRYVWYHKGIDIANNTSPDILAADSGTVVIAGWPDNRGFGNRVVIDHGNGYRTLYAHLSRVYVSVGQTVARGNSIGKMGSTGRSTGIHVHFEVLSAGNYLNPLNVLR